LPRRRRASRYIVLNAVRFSGLAMLMIGIAIARGVIDAPYWLGVALAVAGLLDFFFAPRLLARALGIAGRQAGMIRRFYKDVTLASHAGGFR
jgi:hypothetical protein